MTPLTTVGVTSNERAMPVWMMATGRSRLTFFWLT
jgi:hypothetical protein